MIISLRVRGRITSKLQNDNLEAHVEEMVREKAKLEDDIKDQREDILKAINQLKDQDRDIASMNAQIFYLRQGKSSGS